MYPQIASWDKSLIRAPQDKSLGSTMITSWDKSLIHAP